MVKRWNMCPVCLVRALELRLDKKGRTMFSCRNCASQLFVRMGIQGAANLSATCEVLENETVWTTVRVNGIEYGRLMMRGKLAEILSSQDVAVEPFAAVGGEKVAVNQ